MVTTCLLTYLLWLPCSVRTMQLFSTSEIPWSRARMGVTWCSTSAAQNTHDRKAMAWAALGHFWWADHPETASFYSAIKTSLQVQKWCSGHMNMRLWYSIHLSLCTNLSEVTLSPCDNEKKSSLWHTGIRTTLPKIKPKLCGQRKRHENDVVSSIPFASQPTECPNIFWKHLFKLKVTQLKAITEAPAVFHASTAASLCHSWVWLSYIVSTGCMPGTGLTA